MESSSISSWAPYSEALFVRRATQPSRPSMASAMMATPAAMVAILCEGVDPTRQTKPETKTARASVIRLAFPNCFGFSRRRMGSDAMIGTRTTTADQIGAIGDMLRFWASISAIVTAAATAAIAWAVTMDPR